MAARGSFRPIALLLPGILGFLFWTPVCVNAQAVDGIDWCKCYLGPACTVTGDLTISREIFESGKNLQATCNIRSSPSTCTFKSRQIYFKYLNQIVNSSYVEIMNETAAQIDMPGLLREGDGKHLYCLIDGYVQNVSDREIPVPIGQKVLAVAERPVQPNITECIVYNWESMVCKWEPAVQDTGIETTQSLYWTILPTESYSACPQPAHGVCIWPAVGENPRNSVTVFKRDFLYYLKILVNNSLGTAEYNGSANSKYTVKPNQVHIDQPEDSSVNETSITLNWSSPRPEFTTYTIIYSITVVSQWQDRLQINVTSPADNPSHTVSGLVPFTQYNITITCIPFVDGKGVGFWSDPSFISISTKADVPGAVPEVSAGGFVVSSVGAATDATKKIQMQLFFKPIPSRECHGVITMTRICAFEITDISAATCRHSESQQPSELLETVIDSHESHYSTNLILDSNVMYSICVDQRTSVGYNESLDLQPVILPMDLNGYPGLYFYAEGNKQHIFVKWTPIKNATSYTVYWCKGLRLNNNRCHVENHLQWTVFNSSVTSTALDISGDHYADYIIAMSAQYQSGHPVFPLSSGMTFVSSIFEIGKAVQMPSLVKIVDNGGSRPGSLVVQWNKPLWQDTGYISHFIVSYCKTSSCSEGDSVVNVRVEEPLNGSTQSVTLTDLDEGDTYWIKVASLGNNKKSTYTKPVSGQVKKSGVSNTELGLIIFGCIVAMAVFAVGLYTIVRYFKKRMQPSIPVVPEMDLADEYNCTEHSVQNGNAYTNPEQIVTTILDNDRTPMLPESTPEDRFSTKSLTSEPNGHLETGALLQNQTDNHDSEGASQASLNLVSNSNISAYNLVTRAISTEPEETETETESKSGPSSGSQKSDNMSSSGSKQSGRSSELTNYIPSDFFDGKSSGSDSINSPPSPSIMSYAKVKDKDKAGMSNGVGSINQVDNSVSFVDSGRTEPVVNGGTNSIQSLNDRKISHNTDDCSVAELSNKSVTDGNSQSGVTGMNTVDVPLVHPEKMNGLPNGSAEYSTSGQNTVHIGDTCTNSLDPTSKGEPIDTMCEKQAVSPKSAICGDTCMVDCEGDTEVINNLQPSDSNSYGSRENGCVPQTSFISPYVDYDVALNMRDGTNI